MKGHPCGLVARMAEELFADALGALAAKPDAPEMAMKAINHARSKTSLWSQPSPIYLQDGALRDNVADHLKSAKWSGRDGAVDLAVECLAVALTARSSLGLFEARRRLAQAFAKERGREWIDAAPAPSKRGALF